jgi:hypothetical protein
VKAVSEIKHISSQAADLGNDRSWARSGLAIGTLLPFAAGDSRAGLAQPLRHGALMPLVPPTTGALRPFNPNASSVGRIPNAVKCKAGPHTGAPALEFCSRGGITLCWVNPALPRFVRCTGIDADVRADLFPDREIAEQLPGVRPHRGNVAYGSPTVD